MLTAVRQSRNGGRVRSLVVAVLVAVAASAVAGLSASGPAALAADTSVTLPPVRHVFIINLENLSYERDTFNAALSPYIATLLPKQGVLLENYYGIGHNSLDNYIAQISGQAPNPQTQADCGTYREFTTDAPMDIHGQAVGAGCVFPASVKTLSDQMDARGLTWKGYMEDMGDRPTVDGGYRCAHPPPDSGDVSNGNGPDKYATKHNPFMYFHSILDDDASCRERVVPLDELFSDLQSVDTTPNLAYITPNNCNDGHDGICQFQYTFDGGHGSTSSATDRLKLVNRYVAWLVPRILASPAFRQDGMVVLTLDESDTALGASTNPDDDASCCNEIPGPNSPSPGVAGIGGGKIGTIIISPYIQPGTETATGPVSPTTTAPSAYNHYSLLRSLEDLFGIDSGGTDGHGHLGFAASTADYPGPGSFGHDVYSRIPGKDVPGQLAGPAPADPTAGRQPVGPRRPDPLVAWEAPAPQGNDLNAVSCPAAGSCVAVGDTGTVVLRGTGGSWTPIRFGTARDLLDVACPTTDGCVAVGEDGLALVSADGGRSWSRGATDTDQALRGVSCPSASRCYAVGDQGTVRRSDDGGLSWTRVVAGVSDPLARIDCPSAGTCFATGGEKRPIDLWTTNAGSTWSSRSASAEDNGTGVACVSAQRCTVSTPNSTARWTADGGASWTPKDWGSPQSEDGGTSANRFLGIACPGERTCYIAANRGGIFRLTEPTPPGVTPSEPASITRLARSNIGDDLHDMACPGPTRCYAVGDEGQIIATTDGTKWTSERSGPLPKTPGETDGSAVGTLRATACMDSGACVAVGDEGSVVSKGGPGDGWVPRSSGLHVPLQTPNLFGVSCTGPGLCVAVGGFDTIVSSTDGGQSWSKQTSPASEPIGEELHAVSCFTGSDCVAVGAYGRVLKSRDGGSTWSEIPPPAPYSLNGVGCSSGGTCVAVGSLGTIVASQDGGTSWSGAASGTLAYLAGVSCASDTECMAVGQNGMALASHDGGRTWVRSLTWVDDGLASIHCPAILGCTAVGAKGTVLQTGDGGLTWFIAGTGTSRGLNGAACAGITACYAVGEGASALALGAQPIGLSVTREGGVQGPTGGFPGGSRCGALRPKSSITRRSIRLRRRKVSLAGRALGRDCPFRGEVAAAVAGRVKRVDVSVSRIAKHRCRYLKRNGRLSRPRSCRRLRFLRARVTYSRSSHTNRWRLKKRARLPRGLYRFKVRSTDRHGVRERPTRAVRRRLR
jgi:photosystem II stability/assembly factor-like uncharacterized protein